MAERAPAFGNEDAVRALADLAGRAGARDLEIGYLHDDVPVEDAGWYATAYYQGARITAEDHRSPSTAALALAERLLTGATYCCRQPVTLADGVAGCRWRLMGARWEPGCDAAPIPYDGAPGDHAAILRSLHATPPAGPNRAARRAARQSGRGKGHG